MNRWICRDLYEEKKWEDFRKWQRGMKENVLPAYEKLEMHTTPSGGFDVLEKGYLHHWINYRSHYYLYWGWNAHHVACFSNRIRMLEYISNPIPLPKRYLYSNGSRPRYDGSHLHHDGLEGWGHIID